MGHAHHFLSRLDRVSLPHVEFALGLYNNPELLQYILHTIRLPERAERIAISVDHPDTGPFLVVTRDGRFVTCLGDGMSPGDLPIVTRGQIDALATKIADLRVRIEECRRLAGPTGNLAKLIKRVHDAGDELSSEEVAALVGLAPLYPFEFLRFAFAAASDLLDARQTLLAKLKHADKLQPVYRDALRAYWNTFWSIGHFSVLAASGGWANFHLVPDELSELLLQTSFSWAAVRQGVATLALRGVWAVGRIGKPFLSDTKRRYKAARSPLALLDNAMGLAAIGLRHPKLYAEVIKALSSGPDASRDDVIGAHIHAMNEVLRVVVSPDSGDPYITTIVQRELGSHIWMVLTDHLPKGAPLRFEKKEDVPEALAMTAAIYAPLDYLTEIKAITPMFLQLAWVARASPEQLYLPREAVRAIREPWRPEMTLQLLRSYRDHYKRPALPQEGPSRQGPCTCGSGKKYKRCCGANA